MLLLPFKKKTHKKQVAERNENQIGGGAITGRGGLLRAVWQEAEAVPRCDEGTTAGGVAHTRDTEAKVMRRRDEQFRLEWGVNVGGTVCDLFLC